MTMTGSRDSRLRGIVLSEPATESMTVRFLICFAMERGLESLLIAAVDPAALYISRLNFLEIGLELLRPRWV